MPTEPRGRAIGMASSDARNGIKKLPPAVWGAASGIGTFLAILVGLMSADKALSMATWGVAILAAAIAALVSYVQAKVHSTKEICYLRKSRT